MGCPEPLEFLGNYNHFSTWPPKYQILLKYVKNTKVHHLGWNFIKKSYKVRKSRFGMIWADFADPRADFPPQNLCNYLGFSWSGQVVRGQWARRGISAISKKFTGIMGKARNSQIFVILSGKSIF